MRRQHGVPYILHNDKALRLQPVDGAFAEGWLQSFIFTHQQAIPLAEIEPAFGSLIPVCRELPTKAGPVDLLFVNSLGMLTLVECKLWKNPEARREVVGQILDYAKELSQWSYEDLQNAIGRSHSASTSSLYELASQNSEDLDESDFIDNVLRNLRRGRFLLLIVGDGIRESVEEIAGFLQTHAHLNFSFALVELGLYRIPEREEYVIFPRVVTQTVEIERAVFRIEDDRIVSLPVPETQVSSSRRRKISEQVFFEKLNADQATKAKLEQFLEKIQGLGLYVEPGQNSLKLKSDLFDANFGMFTVHGYFYNCGITSTTANLGAPLIGEQYLRQLANLFDNGFVRESTNLFWWTAMVRSGGEDRYITAAELLAVEGEWIKIIQNTLDEISKLGE